MYIPRMAAEGARYFEESATWDAAIRCLVIISKSPVIEQNIHVTEKLRIGEYT